MLLHLNISLIFRVLLLVAIITENSTEITTEQIPLDTSTEITNELILTDGSTEILSELTSPDSLTEITSEPISTDGSTEITAEITTETQRQIQTPWHVSVQSNIGHECSGIIIGDKWILTDAFCASFEHSYDYSGYTMRKVLTVRIGWTRMLDEQIISVRRYVVESYHNPSTFALLELSTALKFTDKIQPIKLEDSNRKMANGDIALTSGLEDDRIFHIHHVPIVDCGKYFSTLNNRQFGQVICTETLDNFCRDIGNPLVVTVDEVPTLIGMTVHGSYCWPAKMYRRVYSVRPWIEYVTGI